MKLLTAVTIAGFGALRAWAGESVVGSEHRVIVCMDADVPEADAARALASEMFRRIGVEIDWRSNTTRCRAISEVVQIRIQHSSTGLLPRDALAYAKPIEGVHIVVFYDRVRETVTAVKVPFLLAHVLVHEIAHMLEGCSHHAQDGIMKAQWDSVDYRKMFPTPLSFTTTDIQLIRNGMRGRESRSRTEDPAPSLHPMP
jgi:hypothetical protein